MTVKELMQVLSELPENATISLVDYSANYGDSRDEIEISKYASVCAYVNDTNDVVIEITD